MNRLAALSTLTMWVGCTLALSDLRWFRRITLLDRAAPFVPGGSRHATSQRVFQRTFHETLGPFATRVGRDLARLLGMHDEPDTRLRRSGTTYDAVQFRSRQIGTAGGALVAATATSLLVAPPPPLAVALVVCAPVGAFFAYEHRLTRRSEHHRQRLMRELPTVSEHLGMLLGAGLPLTIALERTATRGNGAIARDLGIVVRRIHSGVAPGHALHDWAALMDLPALSRLVAILDLHQDTTDIGALISDEARSMRRESHRQLLARIERRNEQVWIPVTVATLVPGLTFLAIPFVDALGSFADL